MDTFVEGCQGLGLALAVGMVAGALAALIAREGALTVLAVLGAIGGAALFGWSLTQADRSAWPGWPVGFVTALFAFAVARGVVSGALERASGGASPGGIAAPLILAALVLAGLSLVLPPVSLIAGLALLWLAFARRRRAARKYERLRVLR
jgi:hypothetical protein